MKNTSKKLIIVADFDDTLANKYVYNPTNNSHKPLLTRGLMRIVSKMNKSETPLLIATSRGSDDPNLDFISKLSKHPLIIESGGAFYSGSSAKTLLSENQIHDLAEVRNIILSISEDLINEMRGLGFKLLIRTSRFSSIEFRIQNKKGVGLSGNDLKLYDLLTKKLKTILKDDIGKVDFKQGGSSLNLVPKGVSKKRALEKLFKLLNFDRKDSFVVGLGDSKQDAEIFKFSDHSVSVGDTKVNGSTKHMPGGSKSAVNFLKEIIK